MAERDCDVMIIGAGVAGLAAAGELHRAGMRILVLEARNRIGGRILTRHDPLSPAPIELGAEFVHGKQAELLHLISRARLRLRKVSGPHRCMRKGRLDECDDTMDETEELLAGIEGLTEDCTFSEYLTRVDVRDEVKLRATGYVEGFNAADRNRISAMALGKQQKAEEEIDGDTIQRIVTGYDGVPMTLWRGLKEGAALVRLNTIVKEIRWSRGHVEVQARHTSGVGTGPFTASRVIVTLPVGVLQAAQHGPAVVRFVPEPARALDAARRIVMGPVIRITLLFSEWPAAELAKLSFLHAEGEAFPTWWTQSPLRAPLLTAWSGGPAALRHTGLPLESIARSSIESLARILGQSAADVAGRIVSWHVHDWQSDEFSRGAYSYIPAGALDAPGVMGQAVEDTLWFAGEATDTKGHWGTVHAALASGRRAAREILDRRKNR